MTGRKKDYKNGPKDSNLTWSEFNGLKSLKKRIKQGDLVIAQTDKSSCFAVLSVKQYLQAGECHTKKDREISWKDVEYLQNQVNSHTWWISRILNYSKNSDERRMTRNIIASGQEIPDMVLLVKDHKVWMEARCINTDTPSSFRTKGYQHAPI